MASTGNVFPSTAANVDRAGNAAWSNPGNVVSDNATDATGAVPTDYLVTSGYGFSIPTAATIRGVTVRVEVSETGTGNSNFIAQLQSGSATPTLIGSSKNSGTINGTVKVIDVTGGTADLWGAALTPAVVNSSGFGVSIWSTDTTNTLAIDFVTIAIEWGLPDLSAGDSWWAGSNLSAAGTAIAGGAAALALATSIAGSFVQRDEFLPPPPVAVEESYHWTAPLPIVQPIQPAIFYGENVLPPQAGATVGMSSFVIPTQRLQYSARFHRWEVTDDLPTPAATIVEHEVAPPTWVPAVPAVQFLPWVDDGYVPLPAIALDDGGALPLAAVATRAAAVPDPWPGADEFAAAAPPIGEGAGSAYGQRAQHAPTFVRWAVSDELPATVAVALDEPGWQPLTPPASAPVLLAPWADADIPIAAPAVALDDGGWQAPVVGGSLRLVEQPIDADFAPQQPAIVAEDSWQPPQAARASTTVEVWQTTDEVVPQPAASVGGGAGPPHSGQRAQHLPVFQRWAASDDLPIAATPLPVDEQYHWTPQWVAPQVFVAPVFDQGDIVPVAAPPPGEGAGSAYGQRARIETRFQRWTPADELPTPAVFSPNEQDSPPLPRSSDSANYIVWAETEDIVPQPTPLPVDEAYWQPLRPQPAPLIATLWRVEDEIPRFSIDDDSAPPVAVPAAPGPIARPFMADDLIVPQAAAVALDDAGWWVGLPTVAPQAPAQPWLDSDAVPTPAAPLIDDTPWLPPFSITPPAIVTVWQTTDEIAQPATPLPVDEAYWQAPRIEPYRAHTLRLDLPDEVPTPPPPLTANEDTAPALPRSADSAAFIVWATSDEFVPPPAPRALDDSTWPLPVPRAVAAVRPQPWAPGDEVVQPPAPMREEDHWLQLYSIKVDPIVRVWTQQDEWQIPPPPLPFDQDYWHTLFSVKRPLWTTILGLGEFDGSVFRLPPTIDGAYVITSTPEVAVFTRQRADVALIVTPTTAVQADDSGVIVPPG